MSRIPEYDRGFRDGTRAAITWLHRHAENMNDQHAVQVLNSAAFGFGVEQSLQRKRALLTSHVKQSRPHPADQRKHEDDRAVDREDGE